MEQKRPVPTSLAAFLKDGVEAAECTICKEPFDSNHVVIQIKECGHFMGKACLEKWLQQKTSEGTCPTCRGVLFTAKKGTKRSRTVPRDATTAQASSEVPLTPAQFNAYYGESENIERSNRNGFLSKLWKHVPPPASDGAAARRATAKTAIMRAFEESNFFLASNESNAEQRVLTPYVRRLQQPAASDVSCPLIQLVQTLSRLFIFCAHDFTPSDAVWRAILLFQMRSTDETAGLSWIGLREAAWTLGENRLQGFAGVDQWRWLYLFLFLMPIYRAAHLSHTPSFTIHDVRRLLQVLGVGYSTTSGDERDTNTRIFLLAAVYALERSRIDSEEGQDDRTRRLLDVHTNLAQLKADVERLWMEGLAQGGADIAIGYPEHWWTSE